MARRAAGTQYSYTICEDGQPIGVTLLKEVHRVPGEAELGYWLGGPFWGGGRATVIARPSPAAGNATHPTARGPAAQKMPPPER